MPPLTKRALRSIAMLACVLCAPTALARNSIVYLDMNEVVADARATGRLDGSVAFYLFGQALPAIENRLGEGVTNRKTNAFNKSDAEACRWVLMSALIVLQEGAKKRGADAVVDVVSYYKKHTYADPAKVECHAGAVVAGIALKGTFVKRRGR